MANVHPGQRPKRLTKQSPARPSLPRPGWSALAMGALCLGLWRYTDPTARYYGPDPIFSWSGEFIRPRLREAGGPVELVGAFLAQLDYHGWLGALIFASLLWLLAEISFRLLRGSGMQASLASFAPAVLLAGLFNGYEARVHELLSANLLSLGLVALWVASPVRKKLLGWGTLLLAGAGLFYAAGPITAGQFFIVIGCYELWGKRSASGSVVCGSLALLCGLSAWLGNGMDPTGLFRSFASGWTKAAVIGVYAFIPIAWAVFALTGLIAQRSQARHQLIPRANWVAQGTVMTIALGIALALWSNPSRKMLRIRAASAREDWPAVLAAARSLNFLPPAARLDVNRALFYTGQLNDRFFTFPRREKEEILAAITDGLDVCIPLGETLFDLGQVNLAERYGHEALEVLGERPRILRLLARVNLAKERPDAARVFLRRLERIPFHGAWARHWIAAIDRDPSLAQEPEIVQVRARRSRVDQVERRFSTEDLLRQLVRPNQENRMASAYLLAHLLMHRQPDRIFAQPLVTLGPGGGDLPRHAAEALLAFSTARGSARPELPGWRVPAETTSRFQKFCATLTQLGTNATAASLASGFGDTYWFYDLFGQSAR